MPTPNYTEDDLQNGIQDNAPVVPIDDANTVYNPNRKLTPDELVQKFYSVKEKEPELDQAKIERLQRMGRINQLGQGAKVLADIAGTALGANVRRRQPDTTAPALYQNYQTMLDKYKDQEDAYNIRDFQTKRQNAQFGLQRADRETAQEFANRRQAAIEKNNEARTALDNSKFLASLRQKQEALDNTKAYQKGRLGLEGEKVKIAKEKNDQGKEKPFDPVQVKDKFGNSVKLDQGQWDALYQSAMRDSEFTNGNLKAEISKYKDLPDGGVKQIARAYHDYNQQKEYKANEKAALEQHRQQASPVKTNSTKKVPTFFQ